MGSKKNKSGSGRKSKAFGAVIIAIALFASGWFWFVKDMTLSLDEGADFNFDVGEATLSNLKNIKVDLSLSGDVLYEMTFGIATYSQALTGIRIELVSGDQDNYYMDDLGANDYNEFKTPAVYKGDGTSYGFKVYSDQGYGGEYSAVITSAHIRVSWEVSSSVGSPVWTMNNTSSYPYTNRGDIVSSYGLSLGFSVAGSAMSAAEADEYYELRVPSLIDVPQYNQQSWKRIMLRGPGWVEYDFPTSNAATIIIPRLLCRYVGFGKVYADSTFIGDFPTGNNYNVEYEIPAGTSKLRFSAISTTWYTWAVYYPIRVYAHAPALFMLPEYESFNMTGNTWSLTKHYTLKTEATWTPEDELDPNTILLTNEEATAILATHVVRVQNLSAGPITINSLRLKTTYSQGGVLKEKVKNWDGA